MAELNEQELDLYDACANYDCGDTPCDMCIMHKQTSEYTGFCTLNFIQRALISKAESEE